MSIKEYLIKEIFSIRMCKRVNKSQRTKSDEIPFYKIGTLGSNADEFISRELFEKYRKYNFPKKGHIMMTCSGTIGNLWVYDGSDCFFQDSNIIWFEEKVNNVILNKYFYYLLLNMNFNYISSGSTIRRLYNESIYNILLKVPSLSEQQQIIDIIEPFENLLNFFNKELELYNKFLTLLFYRMKTNNSITFFKFCTLKNYKYNNQTKYVDTSNISKSIFKGFEPIIKLKSRANLSPEKESIIFSKLKGENKIYPIYNEHYLEYVYSTGFINIKSKYNSYIYGYMLTDDFHRFKNISCTGSVMESINNQTLEQWNIPELNYELWSDEYNKLLHLINYANLKIKKVLNILNLLISIYII